MSRYDLTDFEWRVIEPLLPNKPRGVPRVDDRRVLNVRNVIPKTVPIGLKSKLLGEPSPVQGKNGASAFVAPDAP